MNDLVKELRLCVDEREVWELLQNEKISPNHDALFSDNPIILPNSHRIPSPLKLPANSFGLIARSIAYLRFRGYLGHINYSGGSYNYISRFQTIWSDWLKEGVVNHNGKINKITAEKLDTWLENQIRINDAVTIIDKVRRLTDWQSLMSLLPAILTDDVLRNYPFPHLAELKERVKDAQGERKQKEKYPLHLMLPIIQESINYLENYTDDIMLLMEQKKHLGSPLVNDATRESRIMYFFRNTDHIFREPKLKKLQGLCKIYTRTKYLEWKKNKTKAMPGEGPITIVNEAVRRWTAANLIILGLFTAGRSQEITLQPRNVKTPKTRYHEIDQGYRFTRIIWKTARNGKLLEMPIPPVAHTAYANLSRFSELYDGKKTGELIIEEYNKSGRRTNLRMTYILKDFAVWVHGKDGPNFTSHELRHAIASLMTHLNDTNGLLMAAKLLGHSSTDMTKTYEVQLKNIVIKQMQYMADTSEEFRNTVAEYQAEESLCVLNEVLKPKMEAGERFYGSNKGLMQFSGDIVTNPQKWYEFYKEAIVAGEVFIIQGATCICAHSLKNPNQMSCQRGINLNDYTGILPQPSACAGSTCSNAIYTEQNAETLMLKQSQSVKDLAPKELQEMAKEWFYVVGDDLQTPDKKIIDEYIADQNRKNKLHSEVING